MRVQKEMKIYLQNNINLFTIDSQPEPKNCYNIIVIKEIESLLFQDYFFLPSINQILSSTKGNQIVRFGLFVFLQYKSNKNKIIHSNINNHAIHVFHIKILSYFILASNYIFVLNTNIALAPPVIAIVINSYPLPSISFDFSSIFSAIESATGVYPITTVLYILKSPLKYYLLE